MKNVFSEVGVEPNKENKKDIDRVIHSMPGVEYKNCSSTWKLVKEKLAEDRTGFIQELKAKL
ncbi:MAG: hypothetical protein ACW963_04670 [Candidatus Sifarchaeia archaeon]|jgi:hypothetical protein